MPSGAACDARVKPFEAATLLNVPDKDLRKAGLSRGKIATLREVAAAIEQDTLKLNALDALLRMRSTPN